MGVFNRTDMTAHLRSGWVDCFRLCRALAILALGATMHLHLPALAPADRPRVAPLQLASSEVEAAERGIVVNRALIFAPQSRPPESPKRAPRDLPRMPLTGLLARVRSPEPPVARPVPRIAVTEARTPFAAEPAVAPVTSPPPTGCPEPARRSRGTRSQKSSGRRCDETGGRARGRTPAQHRGRAGQTADRPIHRSARTARRRCRSSRMADRGWQGPQTGLRPARLAAADPQIVRHHHFGEHGERTLPRQRNLSTEDRFRAGSTRVA